MMQRLNIVIGLWFLFYNFIESFNRNIATTAVTGHSGQSKMVDSNADAIATAVTRVFIPNNKYYKGTGADCLVHREEGQDC